MARNKRSVGKVGAGSQRKGGDGDRRVQVPAPDCPGDKTGIMGETGHKRREPLDRRVKPGGQKAKLHLKLSI